MTGPVDRSGQTFHRLTVLEDVGRTTNGMVIWRCRCECGNEVDVPGGRLQSGNTKSCGCWNLEQRSRLRLIDISGQRFGKLTVLERAGTNTHKKVLWRCRCDCGAEAVVTGNALALSTTKSCGCIPHGVGPDVQAVLYLIAHEGWNAVKIGVTKKGSNRLTQHRWCGWKVLWTIDAVGEVAGEMERAVINAWRAAGIPEGVPAGIMPQCGYTETAPLHLVDPDQIQAFVLERKKGEDA
jgi:hypothetical protein